MSNVTDGMIVTIDGVVVWDGEAEQLGLPSLVGQPAPVQVDDQDEDEDQSAPEDEEDLPPDVLEELGFDPLSGGEDNEIAAPVAAAGMLIITSKGRDARILFIRHAERKTWEFPGGMIEPGETAEEAAVREVTEETGNPPYGRVSLLMRDGLTGVDYTTFIARAASAFDPKLSEESTDWMWAPVDTPPEPLHPGVRMALKRLTMNELDLARAIANGEYSSPQQFENLWLFALRITGTGSSYRPELNEYVWRDPGLYLNSNFLARCNGLAVIWQHPEGEMMTQDEFEGRIIGTIMLPYIFQDEVWGIAKVYDQKAAAMMRTKELSTSPAVVWRDPGSNETRKLDGGKTLLIEGEPTLVDHLAVCEAGVWDKGGDPTGIAQGSPRRADDNGGGIDR